MLRLSASDPDFDSAFTALVNARREADADVSRDVAAIVARVRAEGDAALRDYTNRFDGHDLDQSGWEIGKAERQAALANLDPELRKAIELAAARIADYHKAQKPEDRDHVDAAGVRLGARWRGVDAAGLYVPGGRAAYPSTVLMNAIPARVAGVERLVMVTPTPKGEVNDLVLAAAEIAGVDEVWRVGGAQAIAALAYGTDRIRPVDVIVGPGNAWVAEAKRQLYGVVGIDMVAGPSEIVVVADAQNDPGWIAADLLSQAEPFYGFFDTTQLEPFTVPEAVDMLVAIAEFTGDRTLVDSLKQPAAARRLATIAHLAGGQPRVWALLGTGLSMTGIEQMVTALLTR